jgi:hypothetical protein
MEQEPFRPGSPPENISNPLDPRCWDFGLAAGGALRCSVGSAERLPPPLLVQKATATPNHCISSRAMDDAWNILQLCAERPTGSLQNEGNPAARIHKSPS